MATCEFIIYRTAIPVVGVKAIALNLYGRIHGDFNGSSDLKMNGQLLVPAIGRQDEKE